MVADFLIRETKKWNTDMIEKVLPHLLESITLLKPSVTGGEDGLVWLGSHSCIYTTRSGSAVELSKGLTPVTAPPGPDWKSLLWTGKISPKIQLFLWKVTQGALPIGANLQLRGLLHNTTCARCGELETVTHLFLHL